MKRKIKAAICIVFREIKSSLLLTTAMANNKKDIKERLRLIARRPKMLKITAVCVMILMIAVCVVACTGAITEKQNIDTPEVSAEPTIEPSPADADITAKQLPALNPDSKNTAFVFSAEKPETPSIDVWEYKKVDGQPVDIKAMLSRIWEGQEYETFYNDDGSAFTYKLQRYQSKHGKFREEVYVWDNGFSYGWEINENYPKRKNFTGNTADKKAHTEAFAFAELMFGEENLLGDGGFLEHGLPFGDLRDEDNNAVNHMFEFNFEHRLNDIPVYGEGMTITVIPEGVPRLTLRWSKFEPAQTANPQWTCDFESALYMLEYMRSFAQPGDNVFADYETIASVKAVYTSAFSGDENIYRPAWRFGIVRQEKLSSEAVVLIDMQTGSVYNEHEGFYEVVEGDHTQSYDTKAKAGSLTKVPSGEEIYSSSLEEHKAVPGPDESIIKEVRVARYVTAYSNNNKTVSDTFPKIGTIACNWKIPGLEKGTKIYVPGYGYGIIEDQGANENIDNLDLDLFFGTGSDAQTAANNWGRKRNLEFYVLK